MIPKVFNIKDVGSGFTLIFPLFSVGVEYSMAKQIIHGIVERWPFLVIFEISYSLVVSHFVPNL